MSNARYRRIEKDDPLIFGMMIHGFYEDQMGDLSRPRGPKTIFWMRKRSRASIRRTSKHNYNSGKRHSVERLIDKTLPDKDKILILRLFGSENIGYRCHTNIGDFYTRYETTKRRGANHDDHSYMAEFIGKNRAMRHASGFTPAHALARLCGDIWAIHELAGFAVSLYALYESLFFDFEDKHKKKPRNNTVRLRVGQNLKWIMPEDVEIEPATHKAHFLD
jgi:hypothetical protein